MKVYFNTKAFDCLAKKSKLDVTNDIFDAELLALGRMCRTLLGDLRKE